MFRTLATAAWTLGLLLLAVAGAAAEERALPISGIVVDEGRRPQAGVEVTAALRDEEHVVTTGPDGRFAFRLAAPADEKEPWTSLRARRGEGGDEFGGWSSAYAGKADAVVLVLEPVTEATFSLRLGGEPAEGVAVLLRSGSKYSRVPIRPLTSDREGNVVVRAPAGSYSLLVTDERYAAEDRMFTLPRGPERVVLGFNPWRIDLEPARTLRVRVLDGQTGSSVGGAHVYRRAQVGSGYDNPSVVRADAGGVAVLERLPRSIFEVGAYAESPRASGTALVADPDAIEVEVRVARAKTYTVRWPIDPTGLPVAEGTELVFRPQTYRKGADWGARVEGGHVVLDGYPEESDYGFAVIDEREAAFLRYELDRRDGNSVQRSLPSRFLRARPVVLRVVDAAGAPVADQPIVMEGWFLLRDAEGRLTRQHVHGDRTDVEGRIRWEGVFWEPARLKLLPGSASAAERPLGLLDPDAEGEEHVVRLGERRTVELLVTLDGVAGLRSDLSVYCGGTVQGYEADGLTGRVTFPVSLTAGDPSWYVSVGASGYSSWSAHLEASAVADGPLRFDVPLRTVVTLAVVLDPEPDDYVSGEDVQLHHWDEASSRWTLAGSASIERGDVIRRMELQQQGISCWYAFPGVAVGRYRLVQVPTGLTTGAFEVHALPEVQQVRFDVTRTHRVNGHLVGAGEFPLSDVYLQHARAVAGRDGGAGEAESPWESRQVGNVRADGAFEITVPVQSTTIRVRHPLLVPSEFTVPADATVHLPLVVPVRPRIVLAIPYVAAEGPSSSAAWKEGLYDWGQPSRAQFEHEIRARAWEGPPYVRIRRELDGHVTWPLFQRIQRPSDQALLVGFDEPGTYTLLLEVPDHVPVLLPHVEVPHDGRRLDPIPVARGSSLRIRVQSPARNPLMSVSAHAVAAPQGELPGMRRDAGAGDGGPLVIAGLPPGTYRVRVEPEWRYPGVAGVPASVERDVTVDGVTDQDIEYDLRTESER